MTAVNVLPIPLVYGSPRIPMNIIYANGFTAAAVHSGGKGVLSGGKSTTTGYNYYASFIGALCEGQVGNLRVIFDDYNVYTPNSTPPTKEIGAFFYGADNQAPWEFITAQWPGDAFGYKDTCYVGFADYQLDSSATVPQLNFIIEGIFQGTSPLNLYTAPDGETLLMDADPAQVIYDFLTNPRYGAGIPAAFIDTSTMFTTGSGYEEGVGDATLSSYCQAIGLAWSVVLNNTESASSILSRWCKNLVVAPVWTGATLKFIPYWDTYFGVNPGYYDGASVPPKYFRPVTSPLFDLDDDDFVQAGQGDDPLVIIRTDLADVKNVVRLDYKDRLNLFNDNVAEAKDENAVELYGPRVDDMSTADEFTYVSYAANSAQLQLQRNVAIRNTFSFKLGWQYCVLDPMDIVTVTDITLGLNKFPVRITSIEEDEKGILTIVAEEFPIGAASATAYPRATSTPTPSYLTNATPDSVNTPVIFEPTGALLTAQGDVSPVVIIGVSGGMSGAFDPNWGGAIVNLSDDDVTYVSYGNAGLSKQGTTTGILNSFSGANPDNTNTLSVTMAESDGALDTVTDAQAAAGLTLCAIVDAAGDVELLAYTTATLTGPNTYNLTGLYRGLYDTIPCTHASGAQFLRVDGNVFSTQLPPQWIGETIYVKLQSFNIYGLEIQPLSECAVYTYSPVGWGTNLGLNPIASALLSGAGVDLNAATGSFDLMLGGFGPCDPILFDVDLGVL